MKNKEKWFPFSNKEDAKRDTIFVFCFHHAGGSASAYRKWIDCNDENIMFVPVELPGKGFRMSEEYIYDMQEISEKIAEAVISFAGQQRYILYGHSMGSAVAFKTAYEIERRYKNKPLALIVSGRHAPCIQLGERYTTDMDDEALIEELTIMGGTPKEILENREILDIFIPNIKNDYKLNESFAYRGEIVNIPIFAYAGTEDTDASFDMLDAWATVTSCEIKKREFMGSHFFLFDLGKPYVDMLKKRIHMATNMEYGTV